MGGRLQNAFLMLPFLILSFLTFSMLIPSIHHNTEWWKTFSLLRFCFDRFHDSAPYRSAFNGPPTYNSTLALRSTSFPLKKCFMAPSTLQALLILVCISRSSLSVSVVCAPRYLKLLTKWTEFLPSFIVMIGGSSFHFVCWVASSRVGGKCMATILKLSLPFPTCILRPNFRKCI
jgi:hypothetical protein